MTVTLVVGVPYLTNQTVRKLNLYEQKFSGLASRDISLSNDTNLLFLR